MQYKFFILPLSPSPDQEHELNVFLRTHKVIEIDKQLVHTTMPCWAFAIRYIQGTVIHTAKTNTQPKVNYAEVLSKEVFIVYERMRSIRKEVATQLGIPAYAVFTNKELAEIANLTPLNTNTLQTIEGIGTGKIEKVGNLFLQKYNETHTQPLA